MKYTRYNIKRKKNYAGMLLIVAIIVSAIIGGSIITKIIYKGQPSQNIGDGVFDDKNNENSGVDSQKNKENVDEFVLYFVQCGYFSNKDNAENSSKNITSIGIKTTIIEDNKKYRVIAYVGNEEKSESVLKILKEKSVNAMKMKIDIIKSDDADNQIAEIMNGYIKLLDTLSKSDVQSVKTSDFKKWSTNLKNLTDGKNVKVLNQLKGDIKSLPDEIKKEDISAIYSNMFRAVNVYRH